MRAAARSKYGVRTDPSGKAARTVDGILFDSLKEARRYSELKLLEKAGAIRKLKLKPVFELSVVDMSTEARLRALERGRMNQARLLRVGEYEADYEYEERGLPRSENAHWFRVIEDVKGVKTALYRWKKRHFENQYGLRIRET